MLNTSSILISGGEKIDGEMLNDILILDIATRKVRQIAEAPFKFSCPNQTYIEKRGSILSLVSTVDKGTCILRFNVQTSMFTTIAESL